MITASPDGQHYEYSTRSDFLSPDWHWDVGDIGRYAAMISCLRLAVQQYKIHFV